jgi:hypothetical protein
MRKIWVSSASIIMGVLAGVAAYSPSANAALTGFDCSFSPESAVAEGQVTKILPLGPCAADWTGFVGGTPELPTVSTVDGAVSANTPGVIRIVENAQGNTETAIGVTQTDTVTARIPSIFELLLGSTSVSYEGINYNLSTLGLAINGKATATVTNGQQATGIYIYDNASASLLGTSESATAQIGPCGGQIVGGNLTNCPGVNKAWELLLSVDNLSLPIADFSITLSETVILNTVAPDAVTTTVDASDPFEITAIDLLDANGKIIPGVSFSDSSGYVFPTDSGSLSGGAPVPEASTWAMILLGFGGLGLAGYRASRKTAV